MIISMRSVAYFGSWVGEQSPGRTKPQSEGNIKGEILETMGCDMWEEWGPLKHNTHTHLSTEPEEGDNAADAEPLIEHLADLHPRVDELLLPVVADRRDERRRLAHQPEVHRPFKVHRHGGLRWLGGLDDGGGGDELGIRGGDGGGELVERVGDHRTREAERRVLRGGRLALRVRRRARVSKRDGMVEASGAGADAPRDEGLVDAPVLECLADQVLLDAANLAEQHNHLDVAIRLVAHDVVPKGGAGVPVASDGDALVDAIRVLAQDVVELVAHPSRARDVGDRARAVQLALDAVVNHAARVADAEAPRLDAADGGGADDDDPLLTRLLDELARLVLWHPLRDHRNRPQLSVCESLLDRWVDGPLRRKIDHAADFRVGVERRLGGRVHGEQHLRGAPVELLDVVAAKGVDHPSDGGPRALAAIIEVEHVLDGAVLEPEDDGARRRGEGHMRSLGEELHAGGRTSHAIVTDRHGLVYKGRLLKKMEKTSRVMSNEYVS